MRTGNAHPMFSLSFSFYPTPSLSYTHTHTRATSLLSDVSYLIKEGKYETPLKAAPLSAFP